MLESRPDSPLGTTLVNFLTASQAPEISCFENMCMIYNSPMYFFHRLPEAALSKILFDYLLSECTLVPTLCAQALPLLQDLCQNKSCIGPKTRPVSLHLLLTLWVIPPHSVRLGATGLSLCVLELKACTYILASASTCKAECSARFVVAKLLHSVSRAFVRKPLILLHKLLSICHHLLCRALLCVPALLAFLRMEATFPGCCCHV